MLKEYTSTLNKIIKRQYKIDQLKESLTFYNREYQYTRSSQAQSNRYKIITKIYRLEREIKKLEIILNNY